MMTALHLTPEALKLATSRAALLDRMRWLAPNSRRRREIAAEIRRLAHEELKLEVTPPASEAVTPVPPPAPQDDDERPERLRYWDK